MATIHQLRQGRVESHPILADEPLRLDASGTVAAGAALLSFVQVSPARVALLVRPPERVRVGARTAAEVTELTHGDHVLHGDLELIVSTDARPARAQAPPGSRCVACLVESPALLACPRCAALACEACWRAAPRGVCFSTACSQPAALDRPLWTPSPADFLDGAEESP